MTVIGQSSIREGAENTMMVVSRDIPIDAVHDEYRNRENEFLVGLIDALWISFCTVT